VMTARTRQRPRLPRHVASCAKLACRAPRPAARSVDDPDMKLGQDCLIVSDVNRYALAYAYFEAEPRRCLPLSRRIVSGHRRPIDTRPVAGPRRVSRPQIAGRVGVLQVNLMPYRNFPTLAIQRKANGRLVPSVSGGKSAVGQIEAVAECLLDNLGRAVSYKRLVTVIGRTSDNPTSRHLLRQYISVLREMLLESNSPYVIAVAQEVGYCLCETAKNPRYAVSVRRDEGAGETGRKVRQLRVAAGLTQTALAKRSGMDRTHLSRLERGRLIPTLLTIKRLTKTLQVTPRSLL
jgi:DNA-binding XRE family transcriptional regulator